MFLPISYNQVKQIIEETVDKASEKIDLKYKQMGLEKEDKELTDFLNKLPDADKKRVKGVRIEGEGIKRPFVHAGKCGTPSLWAYDTGEMVTLPDGFEHIDIVVEAQGDSMKDYKIHNGSRVLVKKQSTFENGQIVLLHIRDTADSSQLIFKKAKKLNNGSVIFINGTGEEIELDDNVEVVGVVKHVLTDF